MDVEIEFFEMEKKAKAELYQIEKKAKEADEEVKSGERFLALLRQYNELKNNYTNEQIIAMFPSMEKFCN